MITRSTSSYHTHSIYIHTLYIFKYIYRSKTGGTIKEMNIMIRMVINNNSNSNNCPTRLNVLRPYSPSRVCFWRPCIRFLPFYYSYTLVVRNIWSMIPMRLILSVCNRRGEDIIYIMSCIIHIIIMAHCRGLPWSIHEERNSLPWMIRMIWDNLKCRNKATSAGGGVLR